jgi:hypothetical protein
MTHAGAFDDFSQCLADARRVDAKP